MEKIQKYIWLSQCFPIGSEKPGKLLEQWDIESIYAYNEKEYRTCAFLNQKELTKLTCKDLSKSQAVLQACVDKNILTACWEEEKYPNRLRNIYNPPVVFYYQGKIDTIDEDLSIAVVGTRNPSAYGKKTTGNLCYEMSKIGITVVSGCAAGIDAFAHAGALKARKPTIGVLGCGLDINYPSKNADLKKEIINCGGALLSELPPGTDPYPSAFPLRNRLLSAISLGVIITEAPRKSGALITASHGLEQGKDIFCLPPHDIYDTRFDGVKSLIKDGAIVVMSAVDVLEQYLFDYAHKIEVTSQPRTSIVLTQDDTGNVLPAFAEESPRKNKTPKKKQTPMDQIPQKQKENKVQEKPKLAQGYTEEQKILYDVLDFTPQFLEDILEKSQLDMHIVLTILTEFEIDGIIMAYSGRRYGLRQEI